MSANSSLRESQAQFFDSNPPLYPWPHLLRKYGLRRLYKPREAFWGQALNELELDEGISLLDLGCGTGIWLERLAKEYEIRGTGIDVSQESLATANAETNHGCTFALGDGYRLPFADGEFDCVISLDTLEHVSDHEGFLREMQRVVKPHGKLFLWSINRQQKYTWNWLLERLGVDVFDRVAHDPNIIPDPSQVARQLGSEDVRIERLDYFNAFFSLALDEVIMIAVSLLKRLKFFTADDGIRDAAGAVFLTLSHVATKLLWRILNAMDRPWQANGLSNGFLLVAAKSADPTMVASSASANDSRRKRPSVAAANAISRSTGVGG